MEPAASNGDVKMRVGVVASISIFYIGLFCLLRWTCDGWLVNAPLWHPVAVCAPLLDSGVVLRFVVGCGKGRRWWPIQAGTFWVATDARMISLCLQPP